ncbi:MAG: hypothetical protein V2I82_01965 [Halieaceae bacterium]|nr:hypothetical protein [Halieaceae bacterium]
MKEAQTSSSITHAGTRARLALVAAAALLAAVIGLAPFADSQEGDPAAPAGDQAGDSADLPPASGGSAQAPLEDYEASEQISEDLSVSFPVDI